MNTNAQNKRSPAFEEIAKSIGVYNLVATIEEDKETLSLFNRVPGLIAFIATLKTADGEILGIGRGTATLNRMSKYVDRAVCYAKNASLIDAMVRATRTLDALYLEETSPQDNSNDVQNFATEKQKNFLAKLVTEKCDSQTKQEYLSKLESPYLSRFDCSNLINLLLTKE